MKPCLECGSTAATLVGAETIYPHRPDLHDRVMWLCPCGAYVGCHGGTTEPLGAPAGKETRAARMRAHAAFDPVWQEGALSRREAYAWLAGALGIDPADCHVGQMDAATAERVVRAVGTMKRARPKWVEDLLKKDCK